MRTNLTVIPNGSITSTGGFSAGAVAAGIKKAAGALDLALISSGKPGAAAAVFTRNRFKAAPILVSQKHLALGQVQAVIVNAGCANAGTGKQGHDAAISDDQTRRRQTGHRSGAASWWPAPASSACSYQSKKSAPDSKT